MCRRRARFSLVRLSGSALRMQGASKDRSQAAGDRHILQTLIPARSRHFRVFAAAAAATSSDLRGLIRAYAGPALA
jgi:hypothetical protein